MKTILASALLICILFLSGCSDFNILLKGTDTPTLTTAPTTTSVPSRTSTRTRVPTNTPSPTFTPHPTVTIESYSNTFPRAWKIAPLTDEQVNQVKECDLKSIAQDRYPESSKSDELIYKFEPTSPCDWAALAYAYVSRLSGNEKIPEIAKNAFGKAISDNPGFAFSNPLFYYFSFDSFPIVNQPPTSGEEIVRVKIEYQWEGMGESVKYSVNIKQADSNPSVAVTGYQPASVIKNLKSKVDKNTVQELGKSFSNLLPIKNQFSLVPCYDNYPDWTVTLTFKDGTRQVLTTNGSNMITIGGPWQTNIDGQDYVQFSTDFIAALDKLIQEVGLPYGEPAALACSTQPVIDQAYP